jgi:hypothetical protein
MAEHAGGYVWFDGVYSTNQVHQRTRFKCAPHPDQNQADGSPGWKRHPFYVQMPRREPLRTLATLDRICDECEHLLVRSEGPVTPHRFIFSAREAAKVLVKVATGETYRDASREVRDIANRFVATGANGHGIASNNGSLAADYLDLFADVVYDHYKPAAWPEIVALDALPFRVRDWVKGKSIPGGKPVASILGAFGYPAAGKKGRVWHLAISGGLDRLSWVAFLRSMPTDPNKPPTWVVCDDDAAIQGAVKVVWPEATIYISDGHIQRNGLDRIRGDFGGRRTEVETAIEHSTRGPAQWAALETLAASVPDNATLIAWIKGKRPLMARQFAVVRPGHPQGAGALEQFFTVLRDAIGIRRYRFRNAGRLERLAKMVALRRAKLSDERRFARIIRTHLDARAGRVGVGFRERADHDGVSSIAALERGAIVRRAAAVGFKLAPDFDPKKARSQVSDAAGRHAAKQRLNALPPSEQRAVKEAKRAYMRDYMAKRREREDSDRKAKGLPPIKRKGAYGPRKQKPLSVISPEELAHPSEDF